MKRYPKRASQAWGRRKPRVVFSRVIGPTFMRMRFNGITVTDEAAIVHINSPGGTVAEFNRAIAHVGPIGARLTQ